jgi:uncharacterized membrane protein
MTTASPESSFPNGAAWATILAAGIGCFAFGALVDLAEASKAISAKLNIYNPAGDLSGKSTLAVIIWLVAWGILNARWKRKVITSPGGITAVTFILIVLAIVATFPPFIELFAAS